LVRGDETDPLIAHLRRDLVDATQVDLAVAFVMRSGLALIEEYLRDTLQRGKAVRILTGDYGDVTDPTALLKLLDLEGDIQVRVFETRNRSFHPKAYLLSHGNLGGVAYVGSSNLSRTALERGVEWNYRVAAEIEPLGFREIQAAFESLFQHPDTRPVDHSWVAAYEARRRPQAEKADVEIEGPPEIPVPHAVQDEALRALEGTRSAGNTAGLVVLATGLGKTWLSAFDSAQPEFQRVLFVAHRDEILSQALATYRRIRPAARFGRYTGTEKIPDADVLFASVQTLHQAHHLEQFDRDAFDYVVIDEFHHAQARTYRRILDYFTPKFLLGLTATPERTDGGDWLCVKRTSSIGLTSPPGSAGDYSLPSGTSAYRTK
jgi:HKD family nuclease